MSAEAAPNKDMAKRYGGIELEGARTKAATSPRTAPESRKRIAALGCPPGVPPG